MPATYRPEDLQQKFRRFVLDRLVDLQAGAGGKIMFLPAGEWQQKEGEERHNAHLHKALRTLPCGRRGRLERERRAADERTGRNGSARIGSRPEDLTTKLQTIQRDLQQGRPPRESTRAGDIERGRARSQNVRPKSQKLPVNQKKVFPPVRFSTAQPPAPRGWSRPK